MGLLFFFFFKQKTAYEMRISDWSSDVCSSDLFCTDNRQGYMRVRYCAQARAVENQCFVVMSGNVGNLPGVENMDVQYAQSCILTPCDFPFARDGIAAEASENIETLPIARVNLSDLTWSRAEGTVRNPTHPPNG